MSNRSLVHISVACRDEAKQLVPTFVHWLDVDNAWLQKLHLEIMQDLCNIIAENFEDIEKKAKSETRLDFRKVAGSSRIAVANAASPRQSSAHNVVEIGDHCNAHLYCASFTLTVWIAPHESLCCGRSEMWPIECIC